MAMANRLKYIKLLSARNLVLGDQVLYSGGNFLSTLLLAHALSPSEFGKFSALILHCFLLLSIGNAIYVLPFQVAKASQQRSRVYQSFLFWLHVLFVGCSLAISLVLSTYLNIGLTNRLETVIILTGLLCHDFARKYLLVQRQYYFAMGIDLLVVCLQALLFLLHGTLTSGEDLHLLLYGLSYFPSLVCFWIWLKPGFRKVNHWLGLFRKQMQQAAWLCLVALIQWGSSNLFVVSAGVLISMEALGAFRLIQSLFGVLSILFQSFENYVLPSASRLYQESTDLSRAYIRHAGKRATLVVGLLLVTLFIFSQDILCIAGGGQYAAYAPVLRGMTVLYFLVFISYPIRLSIRVLLLNRDFFTGYLLSFLFSVFFFRSFVQQWSLAGVVAGLILSQVIMILFWIYRLNKHQFYLWK